MEEYCRVKMPHLRIAKNSEQLSDLASDFFLACAEEALRNNGRFTVALSGGSTPAKLYRKLTSLNIDWSNVFFFFGDERNVPPDHGQSNFRMTKETLFDPLGIPDKNIFRWRTEMESPEDIAPEYAERLETFFGSDLRFDLVLLGLGADGHTASLFPHTDALAERKKTAVANWVDKLNEYRFTLTFPVINNASNVVFLASGKEKAAVLQRVLEGEYNPDILPAQLVQPNNGQLYWFIDNAAAKLLENK